MTIKHLLQAVEEYDKKLDQSELRSLIERLKGKQFWLWDDPDHYNNKITSGDCCFNHIIGAPSKIDDDGKKISMPLLPYQKTLYDSLQSHRRLLILKSRGLGISEFFLRYIVFCCLTGKFGKDARVCIATGPRLETSQDLILRVKNLLAFQDTVPKFERSHILKLRSMV